MIEALLIITAIFILAELIVRRKKAADYIVYSSNQFFGYCPKPMSSGLMRGRYDWYINEIGLRTHHRCTEIKGAIALVGDSIVEGGSYVRQGETLSYLIEKKLERIVHPIAASGWSLSNEIEFIKQNSMFLEARLIIIVVNSDDLCDVNPWSSEFTHPTKTPLFRLVYLVRRLGWPYFYRLKHRTKPEASSDAWMTRVRWLQEHDGAQLIWVLYPNADELVEGARPCAALYDALGAGAVIVDLSDQVDWQPDCYADRLHPNAKGRGVLASVIASVAERASY